MINLLKDSEIDNVAGGFLALGYGYRNVSVMSLASIKRPLGFGRKVDLNTIFYGSYGSPYEVSRLGAA